MSLNAETASIYRALGLRENKPLPDDGLVPRYARVTNYSGVVKHVWMVRLAPKAWGKTQRVEAQCPRCIKWFSAGNLNQHLHGYRTRKGRIAGCSK